MMFPSARLVVVICLAIVASSTALPNTAAQAPGIGPPSGWFDVEASTSEAKPAGQNTSMPTSYEAGEASSKLHEMLKAPPGSVAEKFARNNAKLMDTRILPEAAFGLKAGEVKVLRSAGGRVPDLLRSIHLAQHVLGAKEIILMHHTKCGLLHARDQDIRKTLVEKIGRRVKPFADVMTYFGFEDLHQSVHDDIALLKNDPLVDTTLITGWIHDVDTGNVTRVA
ncbi:carbonic anhydrase [Ceraceosorus guamensis]|uniref:Carbonic anhydrase n=1 Tax=Ceraceosorus guamensis TaxID=1522189 RepID=A0A316VRI9_9BASI|nr:carbonic anhydrase [Ceraceosorus guamensis]PWN39834.1 carbonic anhydrase [Ceraceosorus guamensis]